MRDANLFTMLSAYQPGSFATPFENYCTSGLAYLLNRGHYLLTALFRERARIGREELADVEVQPRLGDAGLADLLLTFEGGRRVVVDVQVEPVSEAAHLGGFERVARRWAAEPGFVVLGLPGSSVDEPWQLVSWLEVVEALDDDPDQLTRDYRDFVLNDILGLAPVTLEEAIGSNRLYALGGAAVRRRFGDAAKYANAASRPMGGRYRYVGTMFSTTPEGEMDHWLGIVNETVPLGEHYQLMLASKTAKLKSPGPHPRALGDWKWAGWTGTGRVVRPVTPQAYDRLLERVEAD
jgi:hypothetical protein